MDLACSRDNVLRACVGANQSWQRVRPLASSCDVDVGILNRLLPNKWASRRVCGQLLTVNTHEKIEEQLATSLDSQVLGVLETLGSWKVVPSTRFTGLVEDGIVSLIYLTKRHPNACMVVPELDIKLQNLVDQNAGDLDWTDIGLFWESHGADGHVLRIPNDDFRSYKLAVQTACSQSARFFLSLMTLESIQGALHANIVCFDKTTGILNRFEPYQAQVAIARTHELDEELSELFRRLFPETFVRVEAPPDIGISERQGLQSVAEAEGTQLGLATVDSVTGKILQQGDPSGFCLPWSTIIADVRLMLENQDPSSFAELFAIAAARYGLGWTELIRNFAEELRTFRATFVDEMLQQADEAERARIKIKDPRLQFYAIAAKHLASAAKRH